jgi:hypothetical protein
MSKMIIVEIEVEGDYGPTNAALRGNAAPPYAPQLLAGYIKEKGAGRHEASVVQRKTFPGREIPDCGGEDIKVDDEAITEMALEDGEELLERGNGNESVIVAIRSVTPFQNDALRLARRVKTAFSHMRKQHPGFPEAKIVIGGYHPSGMVGYGGEGYKLLYRGRTYLNIEYELRKDVGEKAELVDAFAVGESEETLLNLADAMDRGTELSEVRGIVFRNEQYPEGKLTGRPERIHTEDDPKMFDLPEAYRWSRVPRYSDRKYSGSFEIPGSVGCTQVGSEPTHFRIRGEIQACASRGCKHNCSFCASKNVNRGTRHIEAQKVVTEIAKYHEDDSFRTNFVYLADLTLNENLGKLAELCKCMIAARRQGDGSIVFDEGAEGEEIFGYKDLDKVHWFCLGSIFSVSQLGEDPNENIEIARKYLQTMREAGCTKIGFGIEGFTPKDIIELKNVPHPGQNLFEAGVTRFTDTALTLHLAAQEGIFSRGYFLLGTEGQTKRSVEQAKAILALEIPSALFNDYAKLAKAITFIFQEYATGNDSPNIRDFCLRELGLIESETSPKECSRLLEVDHIRVAYETPYPNTETGEQRTLQYLKCHTDTDGVLVRDSNARLIPIYADEDESILDMILDERRIPHYYEPGSDSEVDIQSGGYRRVRDDEWSGMTLTDAIAKGWDEWQYLSQENPILGETEMTPEELEKYQSEIANYFYNTGGYRHSMERRAELWPHLREAIYGWQKYWETAGKKHDFTPDSVKREISTKLFTELVSRSGSLPDDEIQRLIGEMFLDEYQPTVEQTREGRVTKYLSESNDENSPNDEISPRTVYEPRQPF